MHILMLSDVYFPRINGVSSSIKSFRDGLCQRGVRVSLLAPAYGDHPHDDADLLRIPGRAVPGDPEDRLMSAAGCRLVGQRRKPDLIHIHTPFAAHAAGIRLARQARIPVVSTYHTLFEEYARHYIPHCPRPLLKGAARLLSKRQCRQVDRVIVPSRAMAERLASYGVDTPVTVLPTGIPVDAFAHGRREAFREFLRVPPDTVVALYVGRAAHEKNIDFLLQVARRCQVGGPEILFVIAGEGPALDALKALANRLGVSHRVRFVGYLERFQGLADCYAAADVFVFASKTETQGLVLLEAMAAGLPVLALAEMGTCDLLAAGRGTRTAPDDPHAFAALLLGLARNPEARAALGAAARAAAHDWAEAPQIDRLLALYRDLIRTDRAQPVGAAGLPQAGNA